MHAVSLDKVTPAAEDGWWLMFRLGDELGTDEWMLVGGQMMHVLAASHGAIEAVRPTDDVDIVVDVRARRGGLRFLSSWLLDQGLAFSGAGPDGIGHRFSRPASHGPGQLIVDLLAPEGVGARTDIRTVPPARTVAVPGSVQAFARSEVLDVTVSGLTGRGERTGLVRCPNLLGALVAKAAATTIAVRNNRGRDWQDAALLLSLIPDPIGLAEECGRKDRSRLQLLKPLSERRHMAWVPLDDVAYRRGIATLSFLIDEQLEPSP